MILIMGDIHGEWGKANALITKKNPSLIIQCGDFGWWPQFAMARSTVYHLRSWTHMGLKTNGALCLFCDGNHENHEDLQRIQKDQGGNKAVHLYEKVFWMSRGALFTLPDGRNVLFYGGADSIDKHLRTRGLDWYPEEIPSYLECVKALNRTEKIDIVVSHTAPHEWVPDVCRREKFSDPTRDHLSRILEIHKPDLWFHGHWHRESQGVYKNTQWYSLDYPGHGGRWWRELKC